MRAVVDLSGEPGASSRPAGDVAEAQELHRLFADLAARRDGALEGIYRTTADELYGLALWRSGSQADAADAVQNVFVRLARGTADLATVRDPLSYLRRMIHRAAIDLHRKRVRRPEEPLDAVRFVEADDPSPERKLDAERVSRRLTELPAAQREAIYFRHFTGCSFAEIGRATGVPTFTAASRYRLGIRRLRRLMGVEQ